jgi:hypothetical protein
MKDRAKYRNSQAEEFKKDFPECITEKNCNCIICEVQF